MALPRSSYLGLSAGKMEYLPFVVTAVIAILNVSCVAATGQSIARDYWSLLDGDVVVRGRVTAVHDQLVPANEAEQKNVGPDAFLRFQFIDFDISEVVRGYLQDGPITFGVGSRSDLTGTYEVGEDMVVSLDFNPILQGGMYVLNSNSGRFVRQGTKWQRRADYFDDLDVSLDEIRNVARGGSVATVTESADVIVLGTVKSAVEQTRKDPESSSTCLVWDVTMVVEDVMKGELDSNTVSFDVFRGGSYWPDWASPAPRRVEIGSRKLVMLRRSGGRFVAWSGTNAIFGVDKRGELRRNDQVVPLTTQEIRKSINKVQR